MSIHPLAAAAGHPKRPRPLYRQLADGSWQLEVRVTDSRIIAELEAASREQQRREFLVMQRRPVRWQ
jgi:hypothetical protein